MVVQRSSYPERRPLRLAAFDYSAPGAYFVTVTTGGCRPLFGHILDAKMRLSRYGMIVERCWYDLADHYSYISLDEFAVMPNHVHGVVWIRNAGRAGFKPAPTTDVRPRHALPEIVRAFKTFSARRINELRRTPGIAVWQRNYYERVIRNERELNAVREYVQTNPLRWHLDRENPLRNRL